MSCHTIAVPKYDSVDDAKLAMDYVVWSVLSLPQKGSPSEVEVLGIVRNTERVVVVEFHPTMVRADIVRLNSEEELTAFVCARPTDRANFLLDSHQASWWGTPSLHGAGKYSGAGFQKLSDIEPLLKLQRSGVVVVFRDRLHLVMAFEKRLDGKGSVSGLVYSPQDGCCTLYSTEPTPKPEWAGASSYSYSSSSSSNLYSSRTNNYGDFLTASNALYITNRAILDRLPTANVKHVCAVIAMTPPSIRGRESVPAENAPALVRQDKAGAAADAYPSLDAASREEAMRPSTSGPSPGFLAAKEELEQKMQQATKEGQQLEREVEALKQKKAELERRLHEVKDRKLLQQRLALAPPASAAPQSSLRQATREGSGSSQARAASSSVGTGSRSSFPTSSTSMYDKYSGSSSLGFREGGGLGSASDSRGPSQVTSSLYALPSERSNLYPATSPPSLQHTFKPPAINSRNYQHYR